jgi:hypothetical protein
VGVLGVEACGKCGKCGLGEMGMPGVVWGLIGGLETGSYMEGMIRGEVSTTVKVVGGGATSRGTWRPAWSRTSA